MCRSIAALILALTLLCLPVCGMCTEIDLSPTAVPEPVNEITLTPISDAPLMEGLPFEINCASVLLVEEDSGQIIFEMNADSPRPVASVTKVMTILLALEMIDQGRISLDDVVTVSADAAGMGGSQVLLDISEQQTVGILLKSMIVGSANDAAVAMAEVMYGSEEMCVEQMNQRAAELGMTNTRFVNCTGLPAEGQHTTARDVAIMSRQMFAHPLYFEYSSIWLDNVDHGDGRVTQLANTNKLLRLYDGCDGGKTGSTNEAGYCISATAKRGDMRLIAVVLGAGSGAERFDIAQEMLDYGFANYRRYPVAEKGTRIRGELPVTGGAQEGVSLMLNGELTLLVLKGSEQGIQLSPNLPESIAAPVQAGDQVGTVAVVVEGRTVAEIPVVTCDSVDSKGLNRGFQHFWQNWMLFE